MAHPVRSTQPAGATAWLLLALVSVQVTAGAPQRIVSLNLCTDSMLLELVEQERIASVTHLSQDPDLSFHAQRVSGLHINHGLAEEILPLQPDLILAGRHTATFAAALLQRLGYRIEVFDAARDLATYGANLRRLGTLVGRRAEAEALLQRLALDLDAPGGHPQQTPLSAVILRANGYTAGRDTLEDDLLRIAGFANLAGELGIGRAGFVTLEDIVLRRPQAIVIGRRHSAYPSVAERLLEHPALRALKRLEDPPQIIDMPEAWWTCAGQFNSLAIARLQEARTP